MKTIEERAEAYARVIADTVTDEWNFRNFESVITLALEELAADLQAEKEKELEQAAFSDGLELRGIIRQIGEMFGETAKTSDDGSVQEDVLALKVPELVDELIAKAAEKEKELGVLARKLELEGMASNDAATKLYELQDRLAEKEKEVAELRVLNAALNVQLVGMEVFVQKYRTWIDRIGFFFAGTEHQHVADKALEVLKDGPDTSLLDEVKRVLTFYSNKVCYDHVGPEGMVGPQTACETGERARQLLTRLSHE